MGGDRPYETVKLTLYFAPKQGTAVIGNHEWVTRGIGPRETQVCVSTVYICDRSIRGGT